MLLAVADLSTATPALGLIELMGQRALVHAQKLFSPDHEGVFETLMDLTEQASFELRQIEGYVLCSPSSSRPTPALSLFQSLALTNRRLLVGVSKLQAMAMRAAMRARVGITLVPILGEEEESLLASAFRMDANGTLKRVMREKAWTLTQLMEKVSFLKGAVGFGPGYRSCRNPLGTVLPELKGVADQISLEGLVELAAPEFRSPLRKPSARQVFSFDPTGEAPAVASSTEWR